MTDFSWAYTSKMIVRDNTDATYAAVPLPPVGGVFRNYAPDAQSLPNNNIYTDDIAELIVALVDEYEQNATADALTTAQLLAQHLVNSHKALTTYTYPILAICQRWTYSGGWSNGEGSGAEYHMRTMLLTAYAYLRLYALDTSDYSGSSLAVYAEDFLDTGRRMQQFSDDRADGVDLPTWMAGSMSEWWNEGASQAATPQWSQHPLFLADVVWKAYTLASTTIGATGSKQDASGSFTFTDVRDAYFVYLTEVLANRDAVMSDANATYIALPYQRMYCAGDGTGVGHNWYTPATDDSATADWTSDAMFWTIEGLALGSHASALTFWQTAVALADGDPVRFVDSYTVTGGETTAPAAADDVTQASALAIRSGKELSQDVSSYKQWIVDTQIDSADTMADGSWTWTGDPVNDYVETIATAVCLWALNNSGWSVADGVVDFTALQDTLYRIAVAKNGSAARLDVVGQLNAIAGTTGKGPVACLQALGATSTELVGALNELAGTSGLALLGAAEAWAEAGGS